ncbi:retrovirus-related pol polyprotein from transposon TNT 1-94 [Tanacetum coccineum]
MKEKQNYVFDDPTTVINNVVEPGSVTPNVTSSLDTLGGNLNDETTGLASSPTVIILTLESVSFATLLKGDTSQKSVKFHTFLAPAGNGVDVAVAKESVGVVNERLINTVYGSFWANMWLIWLLRTTSNDGMESMFGNEPGESIHLYYLRYAKLINDMKMISMSLSNMQINTKFVNHLQPEWSRTQATIQNGQVKVQNVQGRQSQGYAGNARKNQATRARDINTVGNAGVNQPRVIRCYNCNGEGHIAKQCTAKKRVKDSEWFKEKMLLAQAQEAGVVLNDEQQDLLADSLEETDDCEDLQLQATANFKADHVDAYDSDCDDEAIANAIFMANLSLVGSINDDIVKPRYDSNTLSGVPHYDTYHDDDMLNLVVQETEQNEHFVSHDDSYAELTSDSNVISYAEYMVTIQDEADHYVLPPI